MQRERWRRNLIEAKKSSLQEQTNQMVKKFRTIEFMLGFSLNFLGNLSKKIKNTSLVSIEYEKLIVDNEKQARHLKLIADPGDKIPKGTNTNKLSVFTRK